LPVCTRRFWTLWRCGSVIAPIIITAFLRLASRPIGTASRFILPAAMLGAGCESRPGQVRWNRASALPEATLERSAGSGMAPKNCLTAAAGEGDEDKVRASYPAETYPKLAAVKAHYDPVNRFRFNQNIRPAQAR
jgi:hypothetical protein